MPTEELYRSRVANGGIAPAFNNIYDVSINFENSQSLASYLSQSTLYDKQASPGQFLSLFCSEALLPGFTDPDISGRWVETRCFAELCYILEIILGYKPYNGIVKETIIPMISSMLG